MRKPAYARSRPRGLSEARTAPDGKKGSENGFSGRLTACLVTTGPNFWGHFLAS